MHESLTARTRIFTPIALTIGVLSLSSAAILFRASEAPEVPTVFYRVAFSALLLLPLAARSGELTGALRRPIVWLAGVALALHFWSWMTSLRMTSVASSTLFVTTTPVWIAIAARWIPGERPLNRVGWTGMSVALLGGVALIAGASGYWPTLQNAEGPAAVTYEGARYVTPAATLGVTFGGIAMATLGAWLAAIYLTCGRIGRQTLGLASFACGANLVAALVLLAVAAVRGDPFYGWPASTWLVLVALAALPQLLGHNSLLWAVKTVGATIVALVVLTEPVGATALAWFIFQERPETFELVGGLFLLLGLALAIAGHRRAPTNQEAGDPPLA
ncbi:MAG: drug/metabolite transporter (DMT)-like permease [Bradymonadia bacterium]|jgi:drug/metabolite transporter (DMT)-like permease